MKEKIDINLIRRYAQGKYSFKDLKRISTWFNDIRFHTQIKEVIENHWDEFETGNNSEEKDLSQVFDNLRSQIFTERKQLKLYQKVAKVYYRVAAIIVLPLIIYSLYATFERFVSKSFDNTLVEVVSPSATRTHLDLPDGSKVVLNGNSKLKYATNFKSNRNVQLEGEAFFDVAHNVKSPFVVNTVGLNVHVLGTEFSIASYDQDATVEVILKEGKVQLTGTKNSFFEIMNPNEAFHFNRNNRFGRIKKVDADQLTAWKDGVLIFRDEPLREVLRRVGRWYDVQFDVLDESVLDFTYRATFENESLEEVLRLIALTAPVSYEIKNRKLKSNGIYEKKEVIIKLKK